MILDKEVEEFITKNAKQVQEVLIQDIKDNFVDKIDGKLVWKNAVKVRLQELKEQKEILINHVESWGIKCAEWGNGWIDNTGIIKEKWYERVSNFVDGKDFCPTEELVKLFAVSEDKE